MNAWDALIHRLTEPLGVDPELRMDVARELRCHLEDSATEFRRAGQSAEEATASAAAALGDPDELTRQLWQANRRRLRLRGLARWAARATLMPAAAVVIVAMVVALVGSARSYLKPSPSLLAIGGPTPEQRFILHGAPAVTDPIVKAKSISDRWPADPVYYANYVTELMARGGFFDNKAQIKPDRLDEILTVLDESERIDPDNAFYNFKKAGIMAQVSSTLHDDTSRTYAESCPPGRRCRQHPYRVEIHDEQLFDRALAELHRGLSKKTATCRVTEMAQVRLAQLPEPRGVSDMLSRIGIQITAMMPSPEPDRYLAHSLSARAIRLAEEGRADEAEGMIDDALRLGGMIGGHGQTVIEVLVGRVIVTDALDDAQHAYIQLGRPEQVRAAGKAFEEEVAWFERLRAGKKIPAGDIQRSAGLYWGAFTPSLPGLQKDFGPIRSAEKYFFRELALLWLLCLLAGGAAGAGLWALASLAVHRGRDRPVLLFVGWRRIGRICLLGLVAPVAAYFLYAWVLTGRDGGFGLNYTAGKTALEYAVTIGAVLLLLMHLSYTAIRARAEEIGMAVPSPIALRDRRIIVAAGAVVAVAVAVYLAGWWAGPFRPSVWGRPGYRSIPGLILAGVVVAYVVVVGIREIGSRAFCGPFGWFRRSLARSLMPILAAAVIVLGIACGWPLARAERTAVSAAKGRASFDLLLREVEDSDYRLLRQRLAARAEPTPRRAE